MVQILRDAVAAGPLVDVARNLECPLCLALKRPRTARSVNLPLKATRFNEVVHMDFFSITVQNDNGPHRRYTLLSMMDEWAGFAQAFVLESGTAAEAKKALQQGWFKPYGAPKILHCDPDTVFRSEEMRRAIQRYCAQLRTTAAESPWQHGRIE